MLCYNFAQVEFPVDQAMLKVYFFSSRTSEMAGGRVLIRKGKGVSSRHLTSRYFLDYKCIKYKHVKYKVTATRLRNGKCI